MTKKENKTSIFKRILSNRYIISLIAMGIIVCVLVALTMYGLGVYTKHGEFAVVPTVRGLQVEEAEAILKQANLGYEIVDSMYLTGGTPGAIIEQIPEEESKVKKDRIIFLRIQAKGVQMVVVPELRDLSQRQAVASLTSLGFSNVNIEESPSVYKGLVLDVVYKGKSIGANEKLPKGASITVVVGAGGEVLIDSIIDYLPDESTSQISLSSSQNKESNSDSKVHNSFFD